MDRFQVVFLQIVVEKMFLRKLDKVCLFTGENFLTYEVDSRERIMEKHDRSLERMNRFPFIKFHICIKMRGFLEGLTIRL